jgi:hypothetical protein
MQREGRDEGDEARERGRERETDSLRVISARGSPRGEKRRKRRQVQAILMAEC